MWLFLYQLERGMGRGEVSASAMPWCLVADDTVVEREGIGPLIHIPNIYRSLAWQSDSRGP